MNAEMMLRRAALCILMVMAAGCGGGGGGGTSSPPPAPKTYKLGGSVGGLSGTLVLRNNGGNDLTVTANGVFTFTNVLNDGSAYAVTVATAPANQNCTVANGSGTIAGANVSSVVVTCITLPPPPPNTFTVGGAVSGLTGTLVLRNNGADDLSLTGNGNFTFATSLTDLSAYSITVATQPTNQTCTVTNGSGTIAAANVSNIAVNCITAPPPVFVAVGGTVSGLTGTGLILRNNAGNDLPIGANGNFTFTNAIASGSTYDVTIAAQPTLQSCSVTNGKGTANSNITNVVVNCFALQSVIYGRRAGGTQSDIYLVKEDGTGMVALANSADEESTVVLTSAGKILYERGSGTSRSVYSVNADGTGQTLLASSAYLRPDLPTVETPSGKIILTQFSKNIISVNPDGTGLVTLGGTNGIKNFAGITPSGKVIYRVFESTQSDVYSIHSINADGTGDVKISPVNTTEYEEAIAVTPAGRIIMLRAAGISPSANPRDLYSVNEDGTGFVTLSADAKSDDFVALLPNERVLYQRPASSGNSFGQLFSVKADGSGAATLTTDANKEFYVAATKDGKVVYRRTVFDAVTQTNQDDLYIINADGTGLTALGQTADKETFGLLTPTGKIAFIRATATSSDLYLINTDGTGEVRLTNSPEVESLDCSGRTCVTPNGRLIFSRFDGVQNKIFTVNLDGTGEITITKGTDTEASVGVTASGRIIFVRHVGNQDNLYSINADGTDVRTLADTADDEFLYLIYP
jgi:hypothetical protein